MYSMDMAGTSLAYWLWWAGSVGVGVLLLAVGLWALCAGRPRGKLCPRCHYDLSQTDGKRCPECGHEAARLKAVRGKPRHPWIAAVCLVTLNLGVALVVYRQFHSSWRAMIPDRALLLALPLSSGPQDWIWQETQARIVKRGFSESEQRMFVDRCVKGDSWARPLSVKWRTCYGELLRLWRDTNPPDDLQDMLYELPVALELVSRDHWPEDTDVCVQARVDDWWPRGTEIKLTAASNIKDVEPVTFVRTGYYMPANRFAMFLPAMEKGEHTIEYTVEVERHRLASLEEWKPVGVINGCVTIDVGGNMDEVLPAVRDPKLDDIIAGLFSIGIARWEGGTSPVRVYFEPEHTFVPPFQDVAIGASVRILYDGRMVRSMNLWWLGGPQKVSPQEWSLGWEVPWEELDTLMKAPDDGQWSVQVVALQHVALRVIGAKKYWEGAITVPTEIIERDGDAPPVPWRRLDD